VAWVLNAYTIAVASLLIACGRLSDWLGHAHAFRAGLLLFLLASILCGLSPSLPWLVAARALQGVGAALLTPSALALILAHHPGGRQPMAIAIWGATGGLAAAIGPAVGSLTVDVLGWPWAFFLNLPLGLVALVVAWRLVASPLSERWRTPAGIDVPSAVLLAAWLAVCSWALLGHRAHTPRDWAVVAGTGGVLALAFLARSARVERALIPMALWRVPGHLAATLGSIAFSMGFSMLFLGFFFLMTGVWQMDLRHAGLAITPGPLTVIPVTVASGWLARRWGHRPLIMAGSACLVVGSLWMMHPPEQAHYLGFMLPVLLLTGGGIGLVMSSLTAVATMPLPDDLRALGAAVNQTVRQVGSVLGVALTTAWLMQADGGPAGASAHTTLNATMAVLFGVTGVSAWALRKGATAT
jgi:MFS family permease